MHENIELHAVFLKLVFVKTALRMTQIKSHTIRKTSPNLVHGFVETYHIDSVAGFASQSMVEKTECENSHQKVKDHGISMVICHETLCLFKSEISKFTFSRLFCTPLCLCVGCLNLLITEHCEYVSYVH